jgi:geranylgeranyl pyrophosphate synthase
MANDTPDSTPPESLLRRAARVDEELASLFPPEGKRTTIEEAMAWILLGGGKRLRPALALAAGEALGADAEALVRPACALECLHTYSLIHDDLPCMDDDALRRGLATVHVKFGEATAVLAGDALHSLAFELFCRYPEGPEWAARKNRAASLVAEAAGRRGMVEGQYLDLLGEEAEPADLGLVQRIHHGKTACLLRASVQLGAVLGGADAATEERLGRFGERLGLAFQIVDDILDVEGSREAMGKEVRKDAEAGKATYPGVVGVEASRERADALAREAEAALDEVEGADVSELREIARFVVRRRS